MVVIRTLSTALKIKHATLTVEDINGNVMVVEIDTDQLDIDNYIEEDDEYGAWVLTGPRRDPQHVGSRFSLRTEKQYLVTYDKKEPAHG
jgi:hypothetical protein